MYFVYILKLTNNKYFIGRTETVKETIDKHFTGTESEYTKKHKPLLTTSIEIEKSRTHIINTIKRYAYKFGMDNVFTNIEYDKNIITISPLLTGDKKHQKIESESPVKEKKYHDPLLDGLINIDIDSDTNSDFDKDDVSYDDNESNNKKSRFCC
jgi:hypothetical protein